MNEKSNQALLMNQLDFFSVFYVDAKYLNSICFACNCLLHTFISFGKVNNVIIIPIISSKHFFPSNAMCINLMFCEYKCPHM